MSSVWKTVRKPCCRRTQSLHCTTGFIFERFLIPWTTCTITIQSSASKSLAVALFNQPMRFRRVITILIDLLDKFGLHQNQRKQNLRWAYLHRCSARCDTTTQRTLCNKWQGKMIMIIPDLASVAQVARKPSLRPVFVAFSARMMRLLSVCPFFYGSLLLPPTTLQRPWHLLLGSNETFFFSHCRCSLHLKMWLFRFHPTTRLFQFYPTTRSALWWPWKIATSLVSGIHLSLSFQPFARERLCYKKKKRFGDRSKLTRIQLSSCSGGDMP